MGRRNGRKRMNTQGAAMIVSMATVLAVGLVTLLRRRSQRR